MVKGVKLSAKIALDAVMLLILVLLYKAKVLTLTYHEIAGIGILLVFLVHCLFNWRWIANNAKKLFNPETPARTKFSYWISIALVLCFLIIVISGILISKVLFKAQIEALAIDTSVFRMHHLFFSALSLILVGIHLGLYWGMVKGFFRKKFNVSAAIAKPVCYILLAAVVAFGAYSVPTSGFSQWLLCPVIPMEHGHGDHDSEDEGAEQEAAEQEAAGERTDHGDRAERDGQAEQAAQTESSNHGDRGDRADQESGKNGKQKGSGNHGNNVELPNVLLTIAQFTSIVGLFAAITYYVNEALRRRKKAVK